MCGSGLKILVTGGFRAGKSSVVKALSSGDSINIEKHGTTVALDYGKTDVSGLTIHLFGTPGLKHFRVLREILSKGADGVLFVVDSADERRDEEALTVWREVKEFLPGVVCVVMANKQDIDGARRPEEVREALGIPGDVPVVGTSAVTGLNVSLSLRRLLALLVKKAAPILSVLDAYDGEVGGISRFSEKMGFNLSSTRKVLNWLELRGYLDVDWRTEVFWLRDAIKTILKSPDMLLRGSD
ncbi:MAG: ADP-ribosylation factor-like protein [Candidatus Freyarchaeota archaeon]|nr:ADP-ribosylation factor-like protein [Candidatus Freyrarchaeum guaymaensis]